MTELRERLQEITDCFGVNFHPKLIDDIRDTNPHTIIVLTGPEDYLGYNCVMYALGIQSDPTSNAKYRAMLTFCPQNIHADTEFIQFLVDRGYLIESEGQQPGTLIAYLDDERFRHIGVVVECGVVRSKWGTGHLYEHGIFETPTMYGEHVRYYDPIGCDDVLDAFFEFAESHGVSFP